MFVRLLTILATLVCCAAAAADIDLEFRPLGLIVDVGDQVDFGLYAVSGDDTTQLSAAMQVVLIWDSEFLLLLGHDDEGGVPLIYSAFPDPEPFGLNESVPPIDGDGIYVAMGQLPPGSIEATPEGALITTFQFEAVAVGVATIRMDLPAGDPEAHTIVFDATIPGYDVTGSLGIAYVLVLRHPCDGDYDENGFVDSGDLAQLLGWWFSPNGDLNDDGTTDSADLTILLGNWGPCG